LSINNVWWQNRLRKVDANHFFNLLTSPQLLEHMEVHLPEHRERKFPPTLALSMFLGQVMSADGSCQEAVNAAMVTRLLSGLAPAVQAAAGTVRHADGLPALMISSLARATGRLLNEHTPQGWLWRGRHVKLVMGRRPGWRIAHRITVFSPA